MLNKKVEEAINAQINAELWSAYLYLSMAAYCHAQGQPGMAKWFEVQFREEQDHAKIFFNYVVSRDGVVTLKPIAAVTTTWSLHARQGARRTCLHPGCSARGQRVKPSHPSPTRHPSPGCLFFDFGGVATSSAKPHATPVAAAAMALVAAMAKVRIYNNLET